MRRLSTLLTVVGLMACSASLFPSAAQTVPHTSGKPKSAQGHKAPMRHDQLTLYPHGRPPRRQFAYGYTRHRFDFATAVASSRLNVYIIYEARGLGHGLRGSRQIDLPSRRVSSGALLRYEILGPALLRTGTDNVRRKPR
jgi:hypothetical protein